MEEDPNSVPRLGKRMDAPISWQVINHHGWSSIFQYICPSGSAKAQFSNIFYFPVGQTGCCLEWPRKPTTGRFHSSQKWSTLLVFSCNMDLDEFKLSSLIPGSCCKTVAPTQTLRSIWLIRPGHETYIGLLVLQKTCSPFENFSSRLLGSGFVTCRCPASFTSGNTLCHQHRDLRREQGILLPGVTISNVGDSSF